MYILSLSLLLISYNWLWFILPWTIVYYNILLKMKNWKTAIILKVQLLRAHGEPELPGHAPTSTSRAGYRHHRPPDKLLLLLPVRSVDVLLPAFLQVVPWRHHPVHVGVRNTDVPWPPVDISGGFSSRKVCPVVRKLAKKLFVSCCVGLMNVTECSMKYKLQNQG